MSEANLLAQQTASLRDQFAMAALAACLHGSRAGAWSDSATLMAERAYDLADAMMRVRDGHD